MMGRAVAFSLGQKFGFFFKSCWKTLLQIFKLPFQKYSSVHFLSLGVIPGIFLSSSFWPFTSSGALPRPKNTSRFLSPAGCCSGPAPSTIGESQHIDIRNSIDPSFPAWKRRLTNHRKGFVLHTLTSLQFWDRRQGMANQEKSEEGRFFIYSCIEQSGILWWPTSSLCANV